MIPIKTPDEIKVMAEGGKILAGIMKVLEKQIRPGVSPLELDRLAESLISCPPKPWRRRIKSEIKPSFKGYEGFPNCLCVSVNNVIVHGLPSSGSLKDGEVVSLDLGILYKGFHTDMARTFAVGKISPEAKKLIEATKKSLALAIKTVRPGKHFGDIEWLTQNYIESQGFNVVRELCGHGIGRELHEDPQIMNFGRKGTGAEIKEGMVFCIEPMVTIGDWRLKQSADGFGHETKDESLCCHFEDTVAVFGGKALVLTKI